MSDRLASYPREDREGIGFSSSAGGERLAVGHAHIAGREFARTEGDGWTVVANVQPIVNVHCSTRNPPAEWSAANRDLQPR